MLYRFLCCSAKGMRSIINEPVSAPPPAWLGLYSTAPVGSIRGLVEGIVWNVVFAWIAAITFGTIYNSLAPEH